jgi:hypothetical protein
MFTAARTRTFGSHDMLSNTYGKSLSRSDLNLRRNNNYEMKKTNLTIISFYDKIKNNSTFVTPPQRVTRPLPPGRVCTLGLTRPNMQGGIALLA